MGKTTKELVANKISQPNAFDNSKKLESQSSSAIFYKNTGYLSYNCSHWGGTNKKSFRQWEHPKNIIEGKQSQCGTTEKRYGSHNEIQHIGSPTGDIPRPAMLHIYDFNKSFLNSSSKIDHLIVTFKYRVINVTDSGKFWTNNLTDNELAKIQGYKAWFGSWDQSTKLSSVHSSSTVLKYEGSNKNGYIWKEISMTFSDITASDIFNSKFAFNLQFGMNCSKASTPCFMYIKDFKIKVTYENSAKYIEGWNDSGWLYTTNDVGCSTQAYQTIEAGYKNGNTKIPPAQAPAKLGSDIRVDNKPFGVEVTQIGYTDNTKTFMIIDITNIPGEKTITYCLNSDPSMRVNLSYTAIQRPKPTYYIQEEYKSKEDFSNNKDYIIFKNGCASDIFIYIDSINSTPIWFSPYPENQNSPTNLLAREQIQEFHNQIKNLSCGYHTLYIQRGPESIENVLSNTVRIHISPMEYRFRIYSETNSLLTYTQSKKDSEQLPRYAPLIIQRIDDEPRAILPSVSILDETNLSGVIQHWTGPNGEGIKKGDSTTYNVDLYYAGEFYIKVIEDGNTCVTQTPSTQKITVNGWHTQYYDYLFTRGEDATAFDFDYLVAWEGDNIKTPITPSQIELKHSPNDIRICSESQSVGLYQTGLVKLKVTNQTEEDIFENIKIELNTLIENDNNALEVTTDEWVSEQGIFNNFYNLFYEYNANDNISIENLTPDNDLVDEENVYLHIKRLPANKTMEIFIPYRSTKEKQVFLQYLLFEQPQNIYTLADCDLNTNEMTSYTSTEISLSVVDSLQTELNISGNVDLLNLDPTYECPNECYSTADNINQLQCSNANTEINPQSGGITYSITNVDTNDFTKQYVGTEIINSNELEPYGYYLDSQYYEFPDPNNTENNENINTNSRVNWTQEEIYFPKNLTGQLIYAYINFPSLESTTIIQRTDSKGIAKFYIQIPFDIGRSYTINELLNEVLYFEFQEQDNYNSSTLAGEENPFVEYHDTQEHKNSTILSHTNNYRRYQPGQTVYIPISLTANIKVIQNKISFYATLGDSGTSDEVTILYRICNIKDNQGVFKTTFKTADDVLLIPQEVSENIYAGMNTAINIDSRLDKEIIEKENLNILYLNVINQNKLNKDVFIEIDLGQKISQYNFTGDYKFVDIDIDNGDYAIRDEDGRIIITWLLGEMQEYQKNKAIIKIQANNIGLSDIKINAYDYIHQKDCNIEIQQNKCPKCDEETTYTLKNPSWEKLQDTDGKYRWYKLIDDKYYRRIIIDGESTWIERSETNE